MHSEMGPVRQKPNPEYCKNCPPKCAYDCTISVHDTAQYNSDNLPSYRQTTTIGQMLSVGGRGPIYYVCAVGDYVEF